MKPNNPTKAVLRRVAAPCAAAMLALAIPTAANAADVRLMVDPGHGGKDPGAVSGKVVEKQTNLTISKMVVESAKRQGWAVKMTRKDDRFIPLNARPAKAKSFGATALVSVHSNSMGSRKTGNMTIYRTKTSKRLGHSIMKNMAPLTEYKDIGNRGDSRGLAVLRGSKMPAVIVEVLSVSNKDENKALRDPKQQRAAAEAIVKGVADFHGVDYVPPVVEKKQPSQSKATAAATGTTETSAKKSDSPKPGAENTPATTQAAPVKDATPERNPAPAAAPEQTSPLVTESTKDFAGSTASSRRAPLGETGWIGRILTMLSR